MHREESLGCPFCMRETTQLILPDGDKWVAWCQRCFHARFVEPDELPPELPQEPDG